MNECYGTLKTDTVRSVKECTDAITNIIDSKKFNPCDVKGIVIYCESEKKYNEMFDSLSKVYPKRLMPGIDKSKLRKVYDTDFQNDVWDKKVIWLTVSGCGYEQFFADVGMVIYVGDKISKVSYARETDCIIGCDMVSVLSSREKSKHLTAIKKMLISSDKRFEKQHSPCNLVDMFPKDE